MTEWGFPNFDRTRLDESDDDPLNPPTPRHLLELRRQAEAAARVCLRFQPRAHTQESCHVCGGPRYAHPTVARTGAA